MTLSRFAIAGVSTFAILALPSFASSHKEDEAAHVAMEHSRLDDVLASDIRTDDAARDVFRHPKETLEFFGVTPDMKVGEYSPGGGWYTRILLPLVSDDGSYAAIAADAEGYFASAGQERIDRAKTFVGTFPATAAEWTGVDAANIAALEIDEPTEADLESFDAILYFRALHGLAMRDMVDSTLASTYDLLKPGGVVGVVQHRAEADAPHEYTRGTKGYLKQDEVIAMFEAQGFAFVAASEVNANPADTNDYEAGVWTLPPTLTEGDVNKEAYLAIGESDRMTLLFQKPILE